MGDGKKLNPFFLPFSTTVPWLANSLKEHLLELSPQHSSIQKAVQDLDALIPGGGLVLCEWVPQERRHVSSAASPVSPPYHGRHSMNVYTSCWAGPSTLRPFSFGNALPSKAGRINLCSIHMAQGVGIPF